MRWGLLLATLLTALSIARADDSDSTLPPVPTTYDLAADATTAAQAGVPLLLVFAQHYCEFCDRLDREILNPAQATGAYNGKVLVRRFMMDSRSLVRDFNGVKHEASELAHQMKVYVTPTLLFVDGHGTELASRIVGIDSGEFFSAYLDEAIDAARKRFAEKNSTTAGM